MECKDWRVALISVAMLLAAGCAQTHPDVTLTAEPVPTTEAIETTVATTVGEAVPLRKTIAIPDAADVPAQRPLGPGESGDDVLKLQERLNELHFDVKKPDGYYADNTKSAIWVYQQRVLGLTGEDVDGRVSPQLYAKVMAPLALPPRRPEASSTHAEIDLPSQTMVVYVDNNIALITHISSGSGEKWCAQPRNVAAWPGATTTTLPNGQRLKRMCGVSLTPAGVYKIDRKEKGWYDIPLGKVYNPMFFNGGIAIHGYEDVPFKGASHGCVRIPMHIAEYIGDILHTRDQVFVWDGVKEPEDYGSPPPPLDTPDPTDTAGS